MPYTLCTKYILCQVLVLLGYQWTLDPLGEYIKDLWAKGRAAEPLLVIPWSCDVRPRILSNNEYRDEDYCIYWRLLCFREGLLRRDNYLGMRGGNWWPRHFAAVVIVTDDMGHYNAMGLKFDKYDVYILKIRETH